ncbi:Ammonium Transporter [Cyanidiococcus yangmingshanensis]|uniref:Ammonium Transporter n=1 Tax=Cyanidiococcus yangmingshanensis TaxID=2690220 RepID=A0A7J7IG36_9RHOD|nr:Ammonium Transporter [Cyanidiococcus yangmingshanensis]
MHYLADRYTLRAPAAISAADQSLYFALASIVDGVNSAFLLLTAALVFCMQAGFAMLTVGSVRNKNAKNALVLNLCDACVGGVAYYVLGFGFAFAPINQSLLTADNFTTEGPFLPIYKTKSNGFVAFQHFALAQMQSPLTADAFTYLSGLSVPSGTNNGWTYFIWWFQFTFCLTAASIVAGAICERVRVFAYIGFVCLMMGFVYPAISHAMWDDNGWLNVFYNKVTDSSGTIIGSFGIYGSAGSIDFAGSGVVHITGGSAATVAAIIIGPRIGRFDENGKIRPIPGHNISLIVLGGLLLWFGWFGFNPGSQLGTLSYSDGGFNGNGVPTVYSTAGQVALAAVNTLVLPAAAGITTLMISRFVDKCFDCASMVNGFVTGTVVITSPCSTIPTYSALCCGIITGFVWVFGNKLVERLRIDDPLGAIAVHGFGGTWGVLIPGFFAKPDYVAMVYGPSDGSGGIFYGYGKQLAAQLTEILYIWSFVCTIIGGYFLILKFLGLLRISPEEEILGNDTSHHGGPAYPEDDVGLEEDLATLKSYQKSQQMEQKESGSDSPAEELSAAV